MKPVLLILSLFVASVTLAQRTVGNGGGEAEMKSLLIKENLSSWIKFCNLDQNYCGNQIKIDSSVVAALSKPLTFLPASKAESSCQAQQVVMTHEQLYVKDSPLDDKDLFKAVFSAYAQCAGQNLSLTKINFNFDPIGKFITRFNLVAYQSPHQNYIFSERAQIDLHQYLLNETGCVSYFIKSSDKNSFDLQCTDSPNRFKVYPQETTENTLQLLMLLI